VGEFVDFILLVIGIRALGFSVLTGARELYDFVTTAVNATSSSDLDVAAQHFAQAVTILGAAVVQAVLMKGAAGKVSPRGRPPIKPRIPDADPLPNAPDTAAISGSADAAPLNRSQKLQFWQKPQLIGNERVGTRLAWISQTQAFIGGNRHTFRRSEGDFPRSGRCGGDLRR
jgi:hypothetical protein